MDDTEIKHFIEAALLAAGRPLSIDQLQKLFDKDAAPEKSQIRQAISTLLEEYENRGITIKEVASGFRLQITATMAERLEKLWEERPPRYSRALFETLALIAYRQPMTRGEIEEIRGVAVSTNIMRTLLEREWVRVVGHRDVPGHPALYATTRQFLDYFNLKSLDQLPALAEIRDLETLNAELGFSEPLPEQSADGEPGAPGLTVVGGTEHTPQQAEEDGDAVAADAAAGEPVAVASEDAQPAADAEETDSDTEVEPEARA